MLSKVRALLAKAESTTFPAEAEAFTAKAQELMTRLAAGRATAGATAGRDRPCSAGQPVARRLPIDEPYIEAKSLLLHQVAEHTRCRSTFDGRYALSTVIGEEADVEATELLFNSLLLQAEVALTIESHHRPAGSRRRSRGFRGAFLTAYATRIGERLAAINDAVFDSLEGEEHGFDGWHDPGRARGTAAADRARLHQLDLDDPQPPCDIDTWCDALYTFGGPVIGVTDVVALSRTGSDRRPSTARRSPPEVPRCRGDPGRAACGLARQGDRALRR